MKKLCFKIIIYSLLIALSLEVYVRVFHLTKDYPVRYLDDYNVEKWMPNQDGFSVTGNRRQNFSEYHINSFGFNSYREYNPTKTKTEVALVGDSFIEGFHQNYYNSIGKKIEDRLKDIEVYEYGYGGYDMADQLHLINKYKSHFDLIDYVFLGIKFENDLTRGAYKVVEDRLVLESSKYKALRHIKLLVYLKSIGFFDSPRAFINNILNLQEKQKRTDISYSQKAIEKEKYTAYIANFENLIQRYGFDKKRFVLLIDADSTPVVFMNYLKENHFKYIDFSKGLKKSNRPTNLIYDKHWNNNGRTIIAQLIANYIKNNRDFKN